MLAMYHNTHRGDNAAVEPDKIYPERIKPVIPPSQALEQKRKRMEAMKGIAKLWNKFLGGAEVTRDKDKDKD